MTHIGLDKKGDSHLWHRDVAQHGYRPQPKQPSEGQVKQKMRIISFICGSVVVPLRGTPNFLVVFSPFNYCSNVSSLSLELL